jgi:hypothetical protein
MRQNDAMDYQGFAEDLPLFPAEAIAGPFDRSATQPSPEETLIASLIWKHKGQANPIPIARLRELTGYSERQIKGTVESLIVTHRMKIGARREEPAGYFMIETKEDLAAAVGPYRSQILSMLRRLRVLDTYEACRDFLSQVRSVLEGE